MLFPAAPSPFHGSSSAGLLAPTIRSSNNKKKQKELSVPRLPGAFVLYVRTDEEDTCKIWNIKKHGTDDRAGGQTSDPVIRTGETFQQGLPRESVDVSLDKMERKGPSRFPGLMHCSYLHSYSVFFFFFN